MADKRAEARRRRILENPSRRLEKLQNLSKVEDFYTSPDSQGCQSSHQRMIPDGDCKNTIKNEDNFNIESVSYEGTNENENDSEDINPLVDGYVSTDQNTSTDGDDKLPWLMRKYRLILFVLLAWGIYMVVAKHLDFVLAYLIGHRLPNDLLPALILTVFVAVELQVMFASIFLRKSPETQPQSMFILALSLCGFPRNILNSVRKVMAILMSAFTDLCVYIFVIVILKALDERV